MRRRYCVQEMWASQGRALSWMLAFVVLKRNAGRGLQEDSTCLIVLGVMWLVAWSGLRLKRKIVAA